VTAYLDEHWAVADRLSSSALHTYRLHWLLPDWEWKLEDGQGKFKLDLKSPHGWIQLSLDVQPSISSAQLSLVRAGELIHGQRDLRAYEGWVSPMYGIRIPALSLALEIQHSRSVTLTTEFKFP